MDNFREWLSDNLRYFMLGGAILLIVVVLFFGIRAFMGSGKGDSSKDTADEQVTADNDQGNVPSSPANDGETDGKKDANPMEKANEEITSLIKSYYTALGDKDITTLRTLVDNLAPADESKITNAKYIEGYEAGDIYTKKGLDDDSYVVYSCFYYICQGIDTKVPALAEFYVVKDTDGNWYYLNPVSDGTRGAMKTGWFKDVDGNWYYLNLVSDGTQGAMKTGWFTDPQDGHLYYLDPKTGAMVTGNIQNDSV